MMVPRRCPFHKQSVWCGHPNQAFQLLETVLSLNLRIGCAKYILVSAVVDNDVSEALSLP